MRRARMLLELRTLRAAAEERIHAITSTDLFDRWIHLAILAANLAYPSTVAAAACGD
jgi:hypothetical protein